MPSIRGRGGVFNPVCSPPCMARAPSVLAAGNKQRHITTLGSPWARQPAHPTAMLLLSNKVRAHFTISHFLKFGAVHQQWPSISSQLCQLLQLSLGHFSLKEETPGECSACKILNIVHKPQRNMTGYSLLYQKPAPFVI